VVKFHPSATSGVEGVRTDSHMAARSQLNVVYIKCNIEDLDLGQTRIGLVKTVGL